ncbi:hypothetical protein TTHERM_00146210 (macronuclear) [Tetrahymena thermophila SB210]|uniref:Uncharacterized protein n=1 Tax=Tetrahymena thermophila (strain SB210) TaxID=312017 RepID=I7LUC4_TETTS|nr:hypothetical protein TTHERM_00146210 [Tetrahymena thermophila SB210]EAR91015.3 hypothetical protein TTHERM_00146210 [Tetrahymena thermophila SB210]|eukprot:XP_001011260.3 hypothetical protein TTHERM_00146210 [Tetrahymena thermophila SB210]
MASQQVSDQIFQNLDGINPSQPQRVQNAQPIMVNQSLVRRQPSQESEPQRVQDISPQQPIVDQAPIQEQQQQVIVNQPVLNKPPSQDNSSLNIGFVPQVEQQQPKVLKRTQQVQNIPVASQQESIDKVKSDKTQENLKQPKIVQNEKEDIKIAQKQPTITSDDEEIDEKEKVQEEEYVDLGFKYPQFEKLCKIEGFFEQKFGLKDKDYFKRNQCKFDQVNRIQIAKDESNNQKEQTQKKEKNEQDEMDSYYSSDDNEEEYEETPTQLEEGDVYVYLKIDKVNLKKELINWTNDQSYQTIYLKCQDTIDSYVTGQLKEQESNTLSYSIFDSLQVKVQKEIISQGVISYAQIGIYDELKKLVAVIKSKEPQIEFQNVQKQQINIFKTSIVDKKIQIDENTSAGEAQIEGQFAQKRYNVKNQVKIYNLRIKFDENSIVNFDKNSSKSYFLQIGDSLQQKVHQINKSEEEISLIDFYLQFYPKESIAKISLIELDIELNTQNIVGKGELSLRINAKDIPIEINDFEKHVMTVLVDVESPYSQYELENLSKKSSILLNKSIDSKINNSKLISDSIYQSPQNYNLKQYSQETKMQKSISFRGIVQPVNDFVIQNDSKLSLNLGQTPRPVKLKPLNNVQTPQERNIKKEFFVDTAIPLTKKSSLISLNSKKIDFNKPRDLNTIMKSYNINNGLVKNQSSIQLRKQYNTPSPLNDLGLNKVPSKVLTVKSSIDSSKNYNIISGQSGQMQNKQQMNDNFSIASNNVMKKPQNSLNQIHKKKFNFQKKNVNQFKDQEKFDPDKNYDITNDIFEKSNLRESIVLEKSENFKPSNYKTTSKQNSMVIADTQKDVLQESVIQDSKSSSKLFIDLPQDQQQKIIEERNKLIEDQKKLNRSYIYSKADDF